MDVDDLRLFSCVEIVILMRGKSPKSSSKFTYLSKHPTYLFGDDLNYCILEVSRSKESLHTTQGPSWDETQENTGSFSKKKLKRNTSKTRICDVFHTFSSFFNNLFFNLSLKVGTGCGRTFQIPIHSERREESW